MWYLSDRLCGLCAQTLESFGEPMTKNTLLLATAAVALLTGATNSFAAEISGAGTFTGVSSTSTAGAYKLANELRFSASYTSATGFESTKGVLPFAFTSTNSNGFVNGESLLLTLDMSGAVFDAPGSTTILTATGVGCSVSVSPANPVAAGGTSATYFVSFTGCTATGTGLAVNLPVQVTGANNVVVGARLQSSFGGQLFDVDGGRAQAQFIRSVDAVTAAFTPNVGPSTADVASGYRTLVGSQVGGADLVLNIDTTAHDNLAGGTVAVADVAEVLVTANAVSGSFTGFNLTADGTRFSTTSATATQSTVRTFEINPTSATTTVAIEVEDNTVTASGTAAADLNGVISPTSITLTAQVDLLADDNYGTSTGQYVDFSTATGAFQVVTRNGASFVAPWIAFGGASAQSTIRLANNGGVDTGPVVMTILSDNGAGEPTNTSITLTQAMLQSGALTATGGIPAGEAISVNGAMLRNAFGTTAANGDVQVSIEAQSSAISGKVRVTQASGQIFETSLGNLSN